MRTILALALLSLFVSPPHALARKSKLLKNSLLSVAEPHPGEPANAHPFVNVIVFFGRLADFTPADPSTFRAKMGRDNITGDFTPLLDADGRQIGVRAKIGPERVKIGRRPRNTLRLSIQAAKTGEKGPRARDVDRVRFGAVLEPNRDCTAQVGADTTLIVPGIPVQFEGTDGTSDPDRDELTFMWDFGDGTTSTESDPIHTYTEQSGDVVATLTVSDGQATCTNQVTLEAVPALPPGTSAGAVFIESDAALEFASVAPGSSVTKTLTFKNTEGGMTAVPMRLATSSPSFQLSETNLTLGPGESHEVTVTFAPSATGHQDGRLVAVANATNRQVVTLLMHGYGGNSPGNGPTFAADAVFFTEIAQGLVGLGTFGYMPDGRRFFADNGVHTCFVPGGGSGTGDLCLTDQDCAPNGGTCNTSSTCQGGQTPGAPCTTPLDCGNGSYCPSYSLFDPVDLCSDGDSLYILSDEGSFTEPDLNAETERSISILRMDLDANGNVTKRDILDRTTTETGHIACDGFAAGQGGQLYIPEFHNVPDQGTCFRSEREALVKVAKSNGANQVITGRLDAYEGLADCDDLDPVMQLEVSRDGSRMLAGFESGGLWQIRPSPLFYSADITELFQLHPDGSVLFASTTDSGSTGLVNLYRLTPEQVQSGPLPYSALVPCASFAVPNNTLRDAIGRTVAISMAAERAAVGSTDATALVTFATGSGMSSTVSSLFKVISPVLSVRGTVAFSAPANTTTCSVQGLITLDAQELAF
jgi:PKD repeat protein